MDLKEIGDSAPESHWYYESKYRLIFNQRGIFAKPTKIVEIGAGSKFFINKLLHQYPEAQGWAIDPYFPDDQIGIEDRLTSSRETAEVAGDMYLFLDVLEHVEDDVQLLSESLSLAASGAQVVISVPAFQHLWSGHDVYLGHFRRYSKSMLRRTMNAADIEVTELYYTFSILYPIALIVRKLKKDEVSSNMKSYNTFSNSMLILILKILNPINSNKYFGLTVIGKGIKK